LTPRVADLVERLQQEIQDHRVLIEAERGELKVLPALVHASEVLSSLENIFAGHEAASERKFLTKTAPSEAWMTVDITLLLRVLANMVKNALEAVDAGGTVTAGFEWRRDRPGFWVHNAGVIPENIALQIFQRSFSTKEGLGRGLGTYSMKLIGENYLQAEVSFSSTDEDGTCFYILLPPSAKKE
jgi:signal transduction histidine kinase